MQNADMIVNCGDAGQEGELIQRWVMQKARAKCPVKRLWISSLTEEAIREGFNHLEDSSKFQRLYEAGLCRAIGDWLLGMNATRLYSLKYGGGYSRDRKVLSIGRVQTPTLALIVNRQKSTISNRSHTGSLKPSTATRFFLRPRVSSNSRKMARNCLKSSRIMNLQSQI